MKFLKTLVLSFAFCMSLTAAAEDSCRGEEDAAKLSVLSMMAEKNHTSVNIGEAKYYENLPWWDGIRKGFDISVSFMDARTGEPRKATCWIEYKLENAKCVQNNGYHSCPYFL